MLLIIEFFLETFIDQSLGKGYNGTKFQNHDERNTLLQMILIGGWKPRRGPAPTLFKAQHDGGMNPIAAEYPHYHCHSNGKDHYCSSSNPRQGSSASRAEGLRGSSRCYHCSLGRPSLDSCNTPCYLGEPSM